MENKYAGTGILYDLSILAELDDPGYILEMLSMFLTNYPADLAELSRVVAEKDWPEVERRAHKLKGTISILQATSISPILAAMEANARERKQLDEMPEQLQNLKALLAILDQQLVQEQEQIKKGMA